jgi:hypothetical protein
VSDDDHLPRLAITDWRDALPVKAGRYADGTLRPGFQEFGEPPAAAIWYREEDDVVVLHHNDRLRGPLMDRVNRAVTALRKQVAQQG